ncbi:hypothetical protein [Legionella impletisoli]|uniref:Uncharacterized protein n=1 Tax=Legionella impletisoli TaxID=343510 RepID=A0A917JPR3_9GAMM|nr:hypothetical protein [Legionella impletisoli]GGI80151.1 hypothetical protein GCM10007966_05820 [Legionella impletisoli]
MINTNTLKPNILFLADTAHHTSAVTDHITAITSSKSIHWHVLNPLINRTIDKLDLSNFDAIGIHYSIKPYNNYYLSVALKQKISNYTGVKFLFLQDEYQKVNLVQDYLFELGFHLLFTLVNPKIMDLAYPDPRLSSLKKVTVLTGYVQEYMKHIDAPLVKDRPIDVSYRGRRCEFWLGKLAYEKEWIANEFKRRVGVRQLTLDISIDEADRVYGEAWLQLLKNSKAVLGTESGSSIWDFDDSIRKLTNRYLKKIRTENFDLVYENVLKPYDGNILYNAVSPRVFEAAATRTPMIMFPGEYSGVCKPGEHYIVLEKDFSNLEDVLEKISDNDYLQELADRTYSDLIESDLYSQYAFSQLVEREILSLVKQPNHHKEVPDISAEIDKTLKQYRQLNRMRCFYTELGFIVVNFIQLLFDPKYPFIKKLQVLIKSLNRYLAYLLPRLLKAKT